MHANVEDDRRGLQSEGPSWSFVLRYGVEYERHVGRDEYQP